MKRGLLRLPKTALPSLIAFLTDNEHTFLSEKIKNAQTEMDATVSVEVSSEELETILDGLPPGELRNHIQAGYTELAAT